MRIRLKKNGLFGYSRVDRNAKFEKIEAVKSIMNPDKIEIVGYFKGSSSSGIISFTTEEIRDLAKKIKNKKFKKRR